MSGPGGLPRLLAGIDPSTRLSLADHEARHGPLPRVDPEALLRAVAGSGLRGRGGADFPTGLKLRAVARQRRRPSAVIVNGSETEPAARKDTTLLAAAPHLVLDGAVLAAEAIGASQVLIKVDEDNRAAIDGVVDALLERVEDRVPVELVVGPEGYVTGEETAVLNLLNAGLATPTFARSRPSEKGYHGRPTLVQNVETLAHLALIARHGSDWYRECGTGADPGTTLLSVSGAVRRAGVLEVAFGTEVDDVLRAAGGPREPLQAVLLGGYFGTWVSAPEARSLRLCREGLRDHGVTLGSGVVIALPESACGLHESARIVGYLASQSAGQCGPCVHGLRAIADGMRALAVGEGDARTLGDLERWCVEVTGRGACHHPDGVAHLVSSALRVFADDVARHRRARCDRAPMGLPLSRGSSGAVTAPVPA